MPAQSTRIPRTCEYCGTPFSVRRDVVERGYGRHCSRSCGARARQKRERERPSFVARFWSRVDKSGACWLWTGFHDKDGYGGIKVNGITQRAHRVAWEMANGPIPDGHLILHRCDNPSCVNPDHLFDGTQQDNMTDKSSKGRGAVGEQHPCAKLTEDAIRDIRVRLARRESLSSIGRVYGVHMGTIWKVREGLSWKHVA